MNIIREVSNIVEGDWESLSGAGGSTGAGVLREVLGASFKSSPGRPL